MSTIRIRFLGLTFGVMMIAGVIGASALTSLQTDAAEAKDAKLKQLLNEKLVILQRVAAQMEELLKLQEVGHKELYEAHAAVDRAKLDLCTTDQERIVILEGLLERAKRREAMLRGLPKTVVPGSPAGASLLKVQEAEVDRLDIEIEIERIKSK